jgi:hypothetical protein
MNYSKNTCKELIAICKEKGIRGYNKKNKLEILQMIENSTTTMNTVEHIEIINPIDIPKIDDLELLKTVLENKQAQQGLILLYSQSQSECTRNGVCGMEIGMSREKDQGAILKLFLEDMIHLDIDNTLPEDYIIGTSKISSKHSGGKVGTAVKAKWTSADVSVNDAIQAMIDAPDDYYPHLLLTYMNIKANTITIICISSEHNRHIIKTLGRGAFTVPKGNSRGIEYSKIAMRALLEKRYFTIEITNANLIGGVDPIQRRMKLLRDAGISPPPI